MTCFAFQYLEELSRGYVNVASESALVSCLTSTEDRPSVEFTVFPNPAQEQINITTEDQDYYDVQVVNSRGLTVLELNKSLGLTTIDISGQETGFYMLILTTKNGRDIKKIIVR
ncbi:T9SS type A sorting domain-containing protein [Lewinella cohaerens]|uniref:T9SS type A sorting domain-containing protein n=1 Tax=Lewinella cohaerens TaxID=70995 RepID=UPI000368AEB1